ncbi:MAG: helix-turn-helix domain-containing protein [bacterium]|nr:helix-turn-helix domain-containing protein [bacterium]
MVQLWESPPGYDVLEPNCPSRRVLTLLADKWVLLVIVALAKKGPLRNGELKRVLGDISQKMLVQTLRNLEEFGVVQRTAYNVVPPHVEYQLTDLGESLLVPIGALRDWAQAHTEALPDAR